MPTSNRTPVDDPHAWLRAENWQEVMRDPAQLDPDIRAFLEAENQGVEEAMAHTEPLQEALFAEMKGRIKEDESSVPAPDGPFAYYARFETGKDYALHCRRPVAEGPEQVLLDENALATGQAYCRVAAVSHTDDHQRLAYAVDLNGSEYFSVRVRDLTTGADGPPITDRASGSVAWDRAGGTLFWTELDDNHRPCRVHAHILATGADTVVYEESDPGFFVGVGRTESGDFIVIDSHDHTTSECHLIPADAPLTSPRLVAAREPGVEYDVSHHGDGLIIRTNADDAIDFKLVTVPLGDANADLGRAQWRDLVPHRAGRLILSHLVFGRFVARMERENALPRIVIRQIDTGEEHEIAFDEDAYDLGLVPGLEFDTTLTRFRYSSMTTPASVYDYDMASRARTLRKVQEVPSGHDPARYATRRIEARAPDGETVPVSLLYRVDTPLDGSAPLLLYGYGAYGMSMPASFSTNRLSLVDRGFVYAIAHVRGGMDKGYRWYLDGKLNKKTNTFSDFIACAETLVTARYTSAGRIVAHGGSAGGMLMGAVANQRPDLFLGIVADVPFVDVLNTMLDAELPLTPPEWPEWGNPIEDDAAYARIAGYSPYDNVVRQAYPHMLVTAGLTDPRVTYWEPAKWVARLRENRTNDALLLLKTNMEAGHGGKSGRFEFLREIALMYAFILTIAESQS